MNQDMEELFSKIKHEEIQNDEEWIPDSYSKYIVPKRDHNPTIINPDLQRISELNCDIERITKKKINDKVKDLLISKKESEIDRYCETSLYETDQLKDTKKDKRTASERIKGFEEFKKNQVKKSCTLVLASTDEEEMSDSVYSVIEKNILEQEYEQFEF